MKKETVKLIIRTVSFLICAVILFSFISSVFERKTVTGAWNYMSKLNEFYSLEENTLDYIGVGSSHMYCSINPLEVWNSSGISGFVLATPEQPLMATYHYIVEAFKTQSPKYVVVEGFMLYGGTEYNPAYLYATIDPLKFSFNKINMINNLVEYDQRPEYYFNILKYHTRWRELSLAEVKTVFQPNLDTYKGFVALDGDYKGERNNIPNYDNTVQPALSEFNLNILNKMNALITQNNSQMILMIAPYDAQSSEIREALQAGKEWAEQNNVPVLDYALMANEIGIDPQNDYYDSSHLDVSGAAKLSSHFASFLQERGVHKNTQIDLEKWETDYNTYIKKFENDLNFQ